MSRRMILASMIAVMALAVGLGSCHFFLEDWGGLEAPCTEDRHCKKGYYCHGDLCRQRLGCNTDDDCTSALSNQSSFCTDDKECDFEYPYNPGICADNTDCPDGWDCVEFDSRSAGLSNYCSYVCADRFNCNPDAVCTVAMGKTYCGPELVTGGIGDRCDGDHHCPGELVCREFQVSPLGDQIQACTSNCLNAPGTCLDWVCCYNENWDEDYCVPPGTCEDCQPDCSNGRQCGNDGCGGESCGTCSAGDTCNGAGQCETCYANCDGKDCGDDGCGGSCGTCINGTCNEGTFKCEGCTPDCGGKQCGNDGCGGDTCGTCSANERCNEANQCEACSADCNGKNCGHDCSGVSCGTCILGQYCNGSQNCEEAFPKHLGVGTTDLGAIDAVAVTNEMSNELIVAFGGTYYGTDGPGIIWVDLADMSSYGQLKIPDFTRVDALAFSGIADHDTNLAVTGVVSDTQVLQILEAGEASFPALPYGDVEGPKFVAYGDAGTTMGTAEKSGNEIHVARRNILTLVVDGSDEQNISVDGQAILTDFSVNPQGDLFAVAIDSPVQHRFAVLRTNDFINPAETPIAVGKPTHLAFVPNQLMDTIAVATTDGSDATIEVSINMGTAWEVGIACTAGTGPLLDMVAVHPPFSPANYSYLMALDKSDGSLKIWAVSNGILTRVGSIGVHDFTTIDKAALAPSPDGSWLVTGGNAEVKLWSVEDLLRRKIGYRYPCVEPEDCSLSDFFTYCVDYDFPGQPDYCSAICDPLDDQCPLGYTCSAALDLSGNNTCESELGECM